MIIKRTLFFAVVLLLAFMAGTASSQNTSSNTQRLHTPDGVETYYSTPVHFDISPPLRDMKFLKPGKEKKEKVNREVPNYVSNMEGTAPANFREDPVWQKLEVATNRPASSGPIVNIEGMGNLSGVMPPDPNGDVGPDKYIQVINSYFAIYPKTGSPTPILGPAALHTIWTGIGSPWEGTDDGDPIVLYDQAAGKWMISQFSLPGYPSGNMGVLVAVSTTSDPTGTWYRYVYNFNTIMPDYPKFGIWPDGYYMSVNQFTGATGPAACVWERNKMLTGDPTAGFIYKNCSTASGVMIPSDWDGPTAPLASEPNYFTFISGANLKIWSFHTDWATPANSTITETSNLTPATFSSYFCSASRGRCIPQPGTTLKLESLSDRLMFRVQYRNFGTYETMVACHSVNADGLGNAGMRWYELRNTGSGWSIYQQGTYAPNTTSRWMGSVAMNAQGDIALGYSASDATSVYPSIRYTGRRASDTPGLMTIPEQTIVNGTASQQYSSVGRWGDYSMMSVDPSDDITFWYTNEYYVSWNASTWPWQTRIASFKFSSNPAVTTLAATSITGSGATLNGTINANGLATTYHFEWGTTTGYGNNTTTTSAGSGTGNVAVNAPISGLTPGTTYHFRLVGVNVEGTTNGNDMTVTPGAAVVTTTAASAIGLTSATSGGNVVADGGSSVTARGVCWSITANPTTAGSHTTNGAGLGSFSSSITGLTSSTLYHVRAYATNSYGTFYGDDLTFTTLCGIYSLPFAEHFDGTSIPGCWSQVDHQGNSQVWQFGTISTAGAPVLTGNYAFLNSDGYGSGNNQNADLISPVLNCSGYTNIALAFNHYFREYSAETGTLSYSINGGSTWTVLNTYNTTSATNPVAYSNVIAGASNQPSVQFKWNYSGSYGWWWGIDDISVTGTLISTLSVTPSNQNVAAAAGSTNFTVTSNSSWTAVSNQTWCTVTPSGTGNGNIAANYTLNTTALQRVASITVTVTGLTPIIVTVTQAPGSTAVAPVTTAATLGAPYGGAINLPVTVTGFSNITALSLRLDYNPTLLTFTGSTNVNTELTGLIVNDQTVSASLHKVMMIWSDLTPRTIAAGGKIIDLNFTYITGTAALTWNNTSSGGSECEYADANGNPLPDIPTATFYINGEVHWQPGFPVSGVFKYNNTANTLLDNVKVVLNQGTTRVDSVTTDANGVYNFPSVQNGTYKVLAYTTKAWSSVNATDAIKVQRHFAGLEILTEPVRLLAADVNLSNSINATDAIKIKRRFSGLDTYFDRGDWTFAKPTTGWDTIVVSGAAVTQDFYGLCVGDVNGSNIPVAGKSTQSTIKLIPEGEMEISPGEEFDLPVRVDQAMDLAAISLVLTCPSESIIIKNVSVKQGNLIYKAVGNEVRIAWSEIEPMMLGSRDALITLHLKASQTLSSMQNLAFGLTSESELADGDGQPIPYVTLISPALKVVAGTNNGDEVFGIVSVHPNPTWGQVKIEYQLKAPFLVRVEITDIYGHVIRQHVNIYNTRGTFIQEFDLSDVAAGIYMVKVSCDADGKETTRTLKLVKRN